jgi:hypothetical protein
MQALAVPATGVSEVHVGPVGCLKSVQRRLQVPGAAPAALCISFVHCHWLTSSYFKRYLNFNLTFNLAQFSFSNCSSLQYKKSF